MLQRQPMRTIQSDKLFLWISIIINGGKPKYLTLHLFVFFFLQFLKENPFYFVLEFCQVVSSALKASISDFIICEKRWRESISFILCSFRSCFYFSFTLILWFKLFCILLIATGYSLFFTISSLLYYFLCNCHW